jgi:hypothetical protein
LQNQIGNSKQKTEKEKKRNQKKIKEASRWIGVHQQIPVASPSGTGLDTDSVSGCQAGPAEEKNIFFFLSFAGLTRRR